jgi:transposase
LLERIATLEPGVAELEAEIEQLRQQLGKKQPPQWVKPNRPKPEGPPQPRRKRASEYNHGRPSEPPTRIVQHALDRCPQCEYVLRGSSIDYVRQVIELPEPRPVEIIEHQVIKRYCPHCGRWYSPKLDLSGQVLGQGRMGVDLVSLIGYLRMTLRLPVRAIQSYLKAVYRLSISSGEIVELLHQLCAATAETVEGLKGQMRGSAVVHADETGWRENGRNGYIWGFFTAGEEAVRYYEYDHSRGGAVVKRILGPQVKGHLVTDFYAGYNDIAGKHQRCWPHLLRDLHDLKEAHAGESEVVTWAKAVGALYTEAQAWLEEGRPRAPTQEEREEKYVALVGQARQLGLDHAQGKEKHPCRALAKRLLRHEDELFQFVLVEGLSGSNNLAERSIRPLVIIRKISGGSRSDEGSKTRMALASLFGTWQARGLNPLEECLKLLGKPKAPVPTT